MEPGLGIRVRRVAWESPLKHSLTLLTFEQHILREAPLGSRVWLRVQLGQEAGAVMPGGEVGEVSGDEAVSEGKLPLQGAQLPVQPQTAGSPSSELGG